METIKEQSLDISVEQDANLKSIEENVSAQILEDVIDNDIFERVGSEYSDLEGVKQYQEGLAEDISVPEISAPVSVDGEQQTISMKVRKMEAEGINKERKIVVSLALPKIQKDGLQRFLLPVSYYSTEDQGDSSSDIIRVLINVDSPQYPRDLTTEEKNRIKGFWEIINSSKK
jgi:hypothetical protein